MTSLRVVLAIAAAGVALCQQNAADRETLSFSDPSRPRVLKASLIDGSITVRGTTGNQVVVEAPVRRNAAKPAREDPKTQGLRRLDTAASGLTAREQDNVVTVSLSPPRHSDLVIQVPANASLHLRSIHGDITVEGVSGEIDANSIHGKVVLTNVSGAAVAHSLHGQVTAVFDRVPDKPMSFSTLNGDVDVTMPADFKARVKMRSHTGGIYTDFDVKLDGGVKSGESLSGAINGGGAEVAFTTFHGRIYLRRKK